MGLFEKVKNILFEEEEVEEEVVKEKEEHTAPLKEEVPQYKPINEVREEAPVRVAPTFEKPKEPSFEKPKTVDNDFSERDLFRNESTFKFPAFDEDEFDASMPRSTSLKEEKRVESEYDKRKQERRNEYSRLDAFKAKEEVKEEKKRFKPSPVISPVYGILDKDYKVEDIKEAPKSSDNKILTSKDLDVDSVRAKAFGKLESKLKEDRKTTITTESYDVKKDETPKHEKKTVVKEEKLDDVIISEEPILDDSHNLIEERAKTIDELLKDASDEVIDTVENKEEASYESIEEELNSKLTSDPIIDDEIIVPEVKEEKEETALDDDTLENDLYDLIDSMYDNTEDGE